ncbi:hypothetical protein K505DRAFT_343069 [Melanomma pulvis-pyrius CBS 109.77]|uniref:Uncharacterized protein n=1 Tax=Melanomma pulvis-pyrius CBS 109.77 TaxID=1314802 RepID=A0A6A6WTQ5_9PLEO|nr:hypothetical protein K505DRAFT_343069 [Melanomma pulvis-pyrius CBS 109.77]
MPVEIPLWLVPAFANSPPPPTPLHFALTTAQELLKKLIDMTECSPKKETATDEELADLASVATTMKALWASLDKSIAELKRYRKDNRATKLQRRHIRKLEQAVAGFQDEIRRHGEEAKLLAECELPALQLITLSEADIFKWADEGDRDRDTATRNGVALGRPFPVWSSMGDFLLRFLCGVLGSGEAAILPGSHAMDRIVEKFGGLGLNGD